MAHSNQLFVVAAAVVVSLLIHFSISPSVDSFDSILFTFQNERAYYFIELMLDFRFGLEFRFSHFPFDERKLNFFFFIHFASSQTKRFKFFEALLMRFDLGQTSNRSIVKLKHKM